MQPPDDYDRYIGESDASLRRSRWINAVSWPLLASLGLLFYELTAQPAIGAAVVCARFGWEDFLSARWLLHKDPNRGRGWACFWLYLASALIKVAASAVFLLLIINIISFAAQPAPPAQNVAPPAQNMAANGPLPVWAVTGLEVLAAVALSTLATIWAFLLAWWYGVRVWLSRQVHRARRQGAWPPSRLAIGPGSNWAVSLLMAQLGVVSLPIIFIAASLLVAMIGAFLPALAWLAALAYLVSIVAWPFLFLVLTNFLRRRLIAQRPEDCWPPAEMRIN
jgi:hypothetical protein